MASTSRFFCQRSSRNPASRNWITSGDRGDGRSTALCSSSSLDLKILPRGLSGSNLTQAPSRRGLSIARNGRQSEKLVYSKGVNYVAELGLIRGFPRGVGFPEALNRRKKNRGGLTDWSGCRNWRVSATEDDAEQNPLGEAGYWDGAEGKKQLNDIEDMIELIAEAENLRNTSESTEAAESTSEQELQKQRAEKLREELAQRAKAQAEQRKQAEVMFSMAQRAYGRGVYDKSVELLEAALSNVASSSNLGGEIQIWLAMAYEANSRHSDCITLYKRLESSHPNKQIRRQAADLRYILEAPKLKISKEEMVSIPIIERDYDRDSNSWRQKMRKRRMKRIPQSKDYLEDWLVWDPPRWERNPYFWVAFTVWLTLVGIALMFQD